MGFLKRIANGFTSKYKTWESRFLVTGGIIASIAAILSLLLGVAATPVTGGGSLCLGIAIASYLMSAVFTGLSFSKYWGKAADGISELYHTGTTSNSKMGAVIGLIGGLALGIGSIFCPALGVVNTLVNLFKTAKISTLATYSLIGAGTSSFASAGFERTGYILDFQLGSTSLLVRLFTGKKPSNEKIAAASVSNFLPNETKTSTYAKIPFFKKHMINHSQIDYVNPNNNSKFWNMALKNNIKSIANTNHGPEKYSLDFASKSNSM